MVIGIFWIVLGFLVGLFAKERRNRSFWGWSVFSLVVSPIIGIIVVAILKPVEAVVFTPSVSSTSSAITYGSPIRDIKGKLIPVPGAREWVCRSCHTLNSIAVFACKECKSAR